MVARRPSRPPLLLALLLLLTGLAACTEDDGERRFATDPLPTSERPTASPSATLVAAEPPPRDASPVARSALLVPRGAADRIYFRSGRELWTLTVDGSDPRRVLAPPAGSEIAAVAASPNGDQAAVILTEPGDDGGTALLVLAADGTVLRREPALETALGDAAKGATARSLDWSPQGGHLLVAFSPGGLVDVPLEGEAKPAVLVEADQATAPGEAAWGPTGEAVAFLAPVGGEAPASLRLARVGATPASNDTLVHEAGDGRTVTEFAWLPDGRALLFAEGAAPGGPASGGDLWRVDADGSDLRLVASAGRAAPVAEVRHIAPSPDGRAVAYTVTVPEEAGPRFHSLWVRELATGRAVPLAMTTGRAVTDLWWTAAGLVFRTVPGEIDAGYAGGPFALVRAGAEPDLVQIHAVEPTGPATPTGAATPVGVGTPVASPMAG